MKKENMSMRRMKIYSFVQFMFIIKLLLMNYI